MFDNHFSWWYTLLVPTKRVGKKYFEGEAMNMKKYTYYFMNNKGQKQLARKQTDNEYCYGLVLTNNLTSEQKCIKCSSQEKIIQQEINYERKNYPQSYLEKYTLTIVELIKQENK